MEEGAPPRKRRRLAEAAPAAADGISALRDHLLHEILAFLPARLAVSTALLSRRWRAVWTTSPDVSFTSLSPSFVDSVLRLRDPALPLRSFSLVAAPDDDAVASDPALLRSWLLHRAASPALQRLTLRLPGRFDVPPAVFHLPSLKALELRLPSTNWPAAAFLPSLQRLELSDLNLSLVAKDAISNSCPALKYWTMSFESATPELDVNCPLLEVFELQTRAGPMGGLSICGRKIRKVMVRQQYAAKPGPAYLKLSAPGLQTLEWRGPLPLSAAVDSLPDPLASSLMLRTSGELLGLDENRLLNGDLSPLRVNRLVLPYCGIIEEFGIASFHRRDQISPPAWVHENLKHLELTCFFGGFGSLGLAFLLKKFSKLETLHVFCAKESCKESIINHVIPYTYFHILFKRNGAFGRGGYWDSHNLCLKKLVQVSVHNFSGEKFEYDFLEFLPLAAASLRMITISTDSEEVVLEKVEQLQQSFPHIKISLQLRER